MTTDCRYSAMQLDFIFGNLLMDAEGLFRNDDRESGSIAKAGSIKIRGGGSGLDTICLYSNRTREGTEHKC